MNQFLQIDFGKSSERVVGIDLGANYSLVAGMDLGHFPGFRELRCSEWGRLFSLRTHFLAGPAGRNAGCGQECPPHTNHEKALTGPKIIPGADGGKLVPSVVSIGEGMGIVVGSARGNYWSALNRRKHFRTP